MTTAEPKRGARFEAGNAKRIRAAAEWKSLIGQPREVVEPALRSPTPTLGCKRLGTLFGATGHHRRGIVPGFGPDRLRRALVRVAATHPGRRFLWGPHLRLRELSAAERECLVDAVIDLAPKWWRDGK